MFKDEKDIKEETHRFLNYLKKSSNSSVVC